jgi:hypothetical protein
MSEESSEGSRNVGQRVRLGLKSSLLLVAAGTLLVASGKMRGKIDLAKIRQRLPQGKRLALTSNGESGSVRGLDEEGTSSSAGQLEHT